MVGEGQWWLQLSRETLSSAKGRPGDQLSFSLSSAYDLGSAWRFLAGQPIQTLVSSESLHYNLVKERCRAPLGAQHLAGCLLRWSLHPLRPRTPPMKRLFPQPATLAHKGPARCLLPPELCQNTVVSNKSGKVLLK